MLFSILALVTFAIGMAGGFASGYVFGFFRGYFHPTAGRISKKKVE